MIVAALLCRGAIFAQTFTGSITGTITDPADAAVPQAQIELVNTNTGEMRKATTNDAGRFTFSQLLPAPYSIKITAPGFRTYVRSGFQLTTNQAAEFAVRLEVGSVTEAIEVTGAPPLLDTQTANQSVTLNDRMVQELPNLSRNLYSLALSTAGVTYAASSMKGNVGSDQNTSRFHIAGSRQNAVNILVDGVSALAGGWGGALFQPGLEIVQEFQITKNNYEAQYGRTMGGVVNVTTKGGTQEFHGAAYYLHRNDNFNANDFWNNKYGRPKTEYKMHRFGGVVSGPIWKSKRLTGLFSYEGLRIPNVQTRRTTVPTELEKQGDFSDTRNRDGSLQVIYNPFTTRPNPAAAGKFIRDPYPNNRVPSSAFDAVARNYAGLLPVANMPGELYTRQNNYIGTGPSSVLDNHYEFRVDWARSEMHSLFVRLTATRSQNNAAVLWNPAVDTAARTPNPREQLTVGNTFVLSPAFVLNIHFGAGQWREQNYTTALGYDMAQLGFPKSFTSQLQAKAPPLVQIGTQFGLPNDQFSAYNNYNLQVNATRELRAHSLKFGFAWEDSQMNWKRSFSSYFYFSNLQTIGPDPDSRVGTAGNAMASFLTGFGSSGNSPINIHPATTDSYWAGYVQDTWRATSRLTVTAGLRYEIQPARTERYNRINYFDAAATNPLSQQAGMNLKGGLAFAGANQRTVWDTPATDFAPRIGLTMRLLPRLVARAGYGFYFNRAVRTAPNASALGFSTSTTWVTSIDGGRTPQDLMSNPYPQGLALPPGGAAGLLTEVGQSVLAFEPYRVTPYVQQFSFDLQYEFDNNTMFEIGYAGNQARKMSWGDFQRNQLPDAALSLKDSLLESVRNPFYGVITRGTLAGPTVQRGQLLRPFPHFTGVQGSEVPGASSSYNSASLRFTRRFGAGMMLSAEYKFSKTIDNASEDQTWISNQVMDRRRNWNNMRLDRSLGATDLPHSVALSGVYELPVGKGKRFGSAMHPLAGAVIGGWKVSAIYRYDSGYPLNFRTSDNTFSFGGGQYPNISDRKLLKAENQTIERWFNLAPFSQPAPYTFGNAARFIGEVRSASANNWDIAIGKDFPIKESLKATFRCELFNAMNRVQFARPDANFTSNTFGVVNGSQNSPREIQLALRLAF
jgi:hypothetical protein